MFAKSSYALNQPDVLDRTSCQFLDVDVLDYALGIMTRAGFRNIPLNKNTSNEAPELSPYRKVAQQLNS